MVLCDCEKRYERKYFLSRFWSCRFIFRNRLTNRFVVLQYISSLLFFLWGFLKQKIWTKPATEQPKNLWELRASTIAVCNDKKMNWFWLELNLTWLLGLENVLISIEMLFLMIKTISRKYDCTKLFFFLPRSE